MFNVSLRKLAHETCKNLKSQWEKFDIYNIFAQNIVGTC